MVAIDESRRERTTHHLIITTKNRAE